MDKDVFLDFFNRDSRQIYGLFRYLRDDEHRQRLRQALNIAVFLTSNVCIMPPGFVAEDTLVRHVLLEAESYRAEELIRWPIKESLDEYWEKKTREYGHMQEVYGGLFDPGAQAFVEANFGLLIPRRSSIGTLLVSRWEEAPDSNSYWRTQMGNIPSAVIEIFRRIPRQLAEEGFAVTWEAIRTRVSELSKRYSVFRNLVQHIYFGIYIEEFDLRIITSLPLAPTVFGLEGRDLFYDFAALREIVRPTNLWDDLLEINPRDMVQIRRTEGYFRFRELSDTLCDLSATLPSLKRAMALPERDLIVVRRQHSGPLETSHGQLSFELAGHGTEWAEAFSNTLAGVTELAVDRAQAARTERHRQSLGIATARRALAKSGGNTVTIALFAALEEERSVYQHRWGLTAVRGIANRWTGTVSDAGFTLYGPDGGMGRLPAALSTVNFLRSLSEPPDLIIVTGIAGGFEESGRARGHILVPSQIADLASRKVVGEDVADLKIRPQVYATDPRLGWYLGNQLDRPSWEAYAAREADWPVEMRPSLHFNGTLACVDDVVSGNEYRARLIAAWNGIWGVEMEAGGVMAASLSVEGPQVAVVRAVSDLADPAKTDDVWRGRGIRTIATLLERIAWSELLQMRRG